jgi:uncharacterized protein (TIGR00269 family)
MKCSKGKSNAVIFLEYSGSHLCSSHFIEFTERRVKKELRKQWDMEPDTRIAIGVSGGKDSIVVMHMLHDIYENVPGIELLAITVDEGIEGYRPESIPIATTACKALGIEHRIVSFQKMFNITMDQICSAPLDTSPNGREKTACAYCGVLRRQALNLTAKKWGADYLATGLNLDDYAQSILMNFMRADTEKLARMGPHEKVQPGLVPRIAPLWTIPERETYLYAMLKGMSIHDAHCPYSEEALRGRYRDMIDGLEDDMPGTKHSILRSYQNLKPLLDSAFEPAKLGKCPKCSEPTMEGMCKACEMLDSLRLQTIK